MDGWTEDLRGGLGRRSASPVCQRYGSSGPNVYSLALTHSCLVELPLGQAHTHTTNILSNAAISSLPLDFREKEAEGLCADSQTLVMDEIKVCVQCVHLKRCTFQHAAHPQQLPPPCPCILMCASNDPGPVSRSFPKVIITTEQALLSIQRARQRDGEEKHPSWC